MAKKTDLIKKDDSPDLLDDVYWNFANYKKFDDSKSFSKAFSKYNKSINPKGKLDIERVFNSSKEITIQYMFVGKNKNGDVDNIEESFVVKTKNESGFILKKFMYKVHNRICKSLKKQDATFFEGLSLYNDGSGKPFFFLRLGS